MFLFWKAHIGVSVAAGIIAAVANAIRQQTKVEIALWSIGLAIVGYLTILGLFSIWATMCTPVKLDQQRIGEIQQHKESSDREIAAQRENATLQTEFRAKTRNSPCECVPTLQPTTALWSPPASARVVELRQLD